MNNPFWRWSLAGALALVALGGAFSGTAQADEDRQYYSSWKYHSKAGYYYRNYYYKPTGECEDYDYNYVIYYPDKPDYCYYFDPHEKCYYGRCSTHADCPPEEKWSSVVEEDRGPKIEAIPEESFQTPTEMPAIPQSDDGVTVASLPDDLPELEPAGGNPPGGAPPGGGDSPAPVPAPPGAGPGAPGGAPRGAPGGAP